MLGGKTTIQLLSAIGDWLYCFAIDLHLHFFCLAAQSRGDSAIAGLQSARFAVGSNPANKAKIISPTKTGQACHSCGIG